VLDLNRKTGDDAALRVNAMFDVADANGNRTDKWGIAPTFRWGIGTADEFSLGLYHLEYRNGINYGFPWFQQKMASIWKTDAYYGAENDVMAGGTRYGTFSHVHRFANRDELRTVARLGRYERDQRASAIRFADTDPSLPGNQPPTTLSGATVLNRGSQNKIQDMTALYLQSDYSGRFTGWGLRHELLAGVDLAIEDFTRYTAIAPPGMAAKPQTTIGNGSAFGWVDESLRDVRRSQHFDARALGVYAQDVLQLAPAWKLLGGLRWDRVDGEYRTYATTADPAAGVAVGDPTATRRRDDALWSRRFALLYQPTERASFHLSYGSSFNTSGDAYSFDPLGADTPPEKSRNLELGGSVDWADGRFTTRFALFHATKHNERNRDEDSVDATN
jgi:catecholate siderophore receptor